jgi:carboxymethylenebutenolidase
MSDFVQIQVDGQPMRLFVARPQGFAGARPAVIIMHHKGGIDEFPRDRATRLAEAGYLAAVPDLYHRMPGKSVDEQLAGLRDPEIIADIGAAVDYLTATEKARAGGLAILGHCMGGRLAFLGAAADPRFRAAVAYYSGNMFKPWGTSGPTPFERLAEIRCPVLGFFGNEDKNPSPADVDRLDAELTRLGARHEFHRYDQAGHAFQNFANPPGFRPGPAADSWDKTLRFLADELKP